MTENSKQVYVVGQREGWESALEHIHQEAKKGNKIAVIFDGSAANSFRCCDHESRHLVNQLVIDGADLWIGRNAFPEEDFNIKVLPTYLTVTPEAEAKLKELLGDGYQPQDIAGMFPPLNAATAAACGVQK